MRNELPSRKVNRLKDYDYSMRGAYFVTICTQNRKRILSCITQESVLTDIGKISEQAILKISDIYTEVSVDNYVIMPNHIHLILVIDDSQNGRPMSAPTVSRVINHLKGYVSKCAGRPIWQKSFYEHIIRNNADYEEIRKYIYNNPINWQIDEFYDDL